MGRRVGVGGEEGRSGGRGGEGVVEKSLSEHWELFQVRLSLARTFSKMQCGSAEEKWEWAKKKKKRPDLSLGVCLLCWVCFAVSRTVAFYEPCTISGSPYVFILPLGDCSECLHLQLRPPIHTAQRGEKGRKGWKESMRGPPLLFKMWSGLGWEWDDEGRRAWGKHGGGRSCCAMLMMPDTTVPLGISGKHCAVSILKSASCAQSAVSPSLTHPHTTVFGRVSWLVLPFKKKNSLIKA